MARQELEHTEKPNNDKPLWELDVVCGMDVDPRTTPYNHTYNDKLYRFCNKNCQEHFVNNPEHYLEMAQHHLNVRKKHAKS